MAMNRIHFSRFLASYGMSVVLLLLCGYYACATLQTQHRTGAAAADEIAGRLLHEGAPPARVLIVAGDGPQEMQFVDRLEQLLRRNGVGLIDRVVGDPATVRRALRKLAQGGAAPAVVAASQQCASWLSPVLDRTGAAPGARRIFPDDFRWPTFLMADNLLNVANQVVVIAVIAVGMTMVIVTGGIDLSVGSLLALSAVTTGVLVRNLAHGQSAGPVALVLCSLVAVTLCAAVGGFTGTMVTFFRVPPFIATLAVMEIASGLAFTLSAGQSIDAIPQSFTWLGLGRTFFSIPNPVLLMALVYVVAEVVMSRTRLGRYFYAVGGNTEAARLSGVPVRRVVLLAYVISGAVAGIGGIIRTSELKSASPTYGLMYELYVIAAVVVGGTSLAGGSGKIFGTLIGASHHGRDSKRNEPHRRGQLQPAGGTGGGDSWSGSAGHASGANLEQFPANVASPADSRSKPPAGDINSERKSGGLNGSGGSAGCDRTWRTPLGPPAPGKAGGRRTANFAYHASELGARGVVVSRVGEDELGAELLGAIGDRKVNCQYISRDRAHPTGTVSVVLDDRGKPQYLIHPGVAWDFIEFDTALADLAARADAVCVGTLAQRSPVSQETIHQFLAATRVDCLRVLDLNLRQSYYSADVVRQTMARATVVKLNDEEWPVIASMLSLPAALPAGLEAMRERFNLRLVALTRGGEGSILCEAGGCSTRSGTPVHVVDTIGAGDAFTAAIVVGLLRGESIQVIHDHAEQVASYVCSQTGATPALPVTLRRNQGWERE